MKEIKKSNHVIGYSGPCIFTIKDKISGDRFNLRITDGLIDLDIEKIGFTGGPLRISGARLTIDLLPDNAGNFFYIEEIITQKKSIKRKKK